MSLIRRSQKESLVYWPRIDTKKTGEPIWGPPVEMSCRWEDMKKEIIGANGTRVMTSIQLITETRLDVGGLVKYGTIGEVAYWDDPKKNTGVHEVLDSSRTPNMRATEYLYEACA